MAYFKRKFSKLLETQAKAAKGDLARLRIAKANSIVIQLNDANLSAWLLQKDLPLRFGKC